MSVIGSAALLTLSLTLGCCTIGGTLLGGGAGTVIGGGAGLCCGQPSEGMAKGASIGAASGLVTGAVCDMVILSPFIIVSKVLGCDKSHEAMTAQEIEQLCNAGVDNSVIITQIEQVGMREPLSVKEIIRLKKKGISSEVIQVAQLHPAPTNGLETQIEIETQESGTAIAKEETSAPQQEVVPNQDEATPKPIEDPSLQPASFEPSLVQPPSILNYYEKL